MKIARFVCCLPAFLLCFSLSGCDSGGGAPEVMSNQSEIDKYLAENPDYDEGMDDGSTEEVE